ncbi:MAG: hypothetical protein M1574_04655 [Gammaproteobacteria bacterium]|nr:hypothetical protein [Gammaproteobacteria bacterium]
MSRLFGRDAETTHIPAVERTRSGLRRRAGLLAVLTLFLVGCASQAPSVRIAQATFREGRSLLGRLAAQGPRGSRIYGTAGGRGRILVFVRRAGPLAVFGHNHVVSSRWFTGIVRAGPHPGALFCLPLTNLSINRPTLRRAAGAGFGGTLSPALRRATDRHMLESLRARRHPDLLLLVRSTGAHTSTAARALRLEVVLNGRRRTLKNVHLRVRETPEALDVRARFRLRQTAFDLTPYSILGGGLSVRNTLRVEARIVVPRLRSHAALDALETNWCGLHPPHLGGRAP